MLSAQTIVNTSINSKLNTVKSQTECDDDEICISDESSTQENDINETENDNLSMKDDSYDEHILQEKIAIN